MEQADNRKNCIIAAIGGILDVPHLDELFSYLKALDSLLSVLYSRFQIKVLLGHNNRMPSRWMFKPKGLFRALCHVPGE